MPAEVLLGLLPGEGVGPSLIEHCRQVVERLATRCGEQIAISSGPSLEGGLSPQVVAWMQDLFARGGSVLSGPGGGRYVYDLRQQLELTYKLNPVRGFKALGTEGVDVLVVRHTGGGPFQAREHRRGSLLELSCTYDLAELKQVAVAADLRAQQRRGRLTLALKPHGQPGVAALWREALAGVQSAWEIQECDWVAYQLVKQPQTYDVVVAGDDIGDLLSDLGGLAMGGRGLTFGACFNQAGQGVYQTNHGAAWDLAERDVANPVGQLSSLAMLLRLSAGRSGWADLLEAALDTTLGRVRTPDLADPALQLVSCSQWVDHLLQELA